MNASAGSRFAITFIVRIWTEHAEGEAPQWRGQVEHLQSGEKVYFRKLGQMVAFIDGQRARRKKGHRPDEV